MLQELYAGAVADANSRSQLVTASQLEQAIASLAEPLDVRSFFNRPTVSVIAEIKRASPSKGDLSEIPHPAKLAIEYQVAGAAAISVLTEQRQFKGSLDDLTEVAAVSSVPVLRKDFIATEYQILEARAAGADIVLLIVAGLNQPQLSHLFDFARNLGMAALVETHSAEEIDRAMSIGAEFIGINTRDLSTFQTNRELFGELVGLLPESVVAVAESAVRNLADVEQYAQAGAQAVLVGEALVTGDHKALISEFSKVTKIRL
ncbi:MAG: indole-3-glycerol phosphate synthase TrpC [Acidobacteria bacterium]|nr:indole-3-glycerol phosphate synthase TrpC [Acidobacteriota bacterium]